MELYLPRYGHGTDAYARDLRTIFIVTPSSPRADVILVRAKTIKSFAIYLTYKVHVELLSLVTTFQR